MNNLTTTGKTVTTLKEAATFLINADVVDFTNNNSVEGGQLLEVCGYDTNVSTQSRTIKRQIEKHGFISGVDFNPTMVESIGGRPKTIYHFTFNASQHVLLGSMTEQGKQARQEAINIKENVTNTSLVSLEGVGGMLQVLNGLYQTQVEQQQFNSEVSDRLAGIEEKTVILPNRPQNAESITTIRSRINNKYGLPQWVITEVLNTCSYAPRPAGQVKNSHEESGDRTYTVWNIAEVNRLFERFVRECEHHSKTKSVHNLIEKSFKLIK